MVEEGPAPPVASEDTVRDWIASVFAVALGVACAWGLCAWMERGSRWEAPAAPPVPAGTATGIPSISPSPVNATATATPEPEFFAAPVVVVDPLGTAIASVRSTGHPGASEAADLAALFRAAAAPCDEEHECEPDAWGLAALAWLESGFRAWAVEGDRGIYGAGRGPGLGIIGLHESYIGPDVYPYDPRSAIPAAGIRLRKFFAFHAEHCGPPATPHDPYAHFFGGWGVEGCEGCIISAAEVRSRTARLRAAADMGAPEAPGTRPEPKRRSWGSYGASAAD